MGDLEQFEAEKLRVRPKTGKQSREDCLSAVKKDGLMLQQVIWQTPEICAHAVLQNPEALKYVRDDSLRKKLECDLEPYLKDIESNRLDADGRGLEGAEFILTPFFKKIIAKMFPIAEYYKSYYGRPISYGRVEFEFEEGCRRYEYVREYNPDLPMAREARPWRRGWVMPGDYNYDVIELDSEDEEEIMRIPWQYYHSFLHAVWEVLCGYKKLGGIDEDFWRSLPDECVEYLVSRFMRIQ